jgi:hypothetical protein
VGAAPLATGGSGSEAIIMLSATIIPWCIMASLLEFGMDTSLAVCAG